MDLFSVAPIWDSHEDVEGHLHLHWHHVHPERNHLSSELLHQYLHHFRCWNPQYGECVLWIWRVDDKFTRDGFSSRRCLGVTPGDGRHRFNDSPYLALIKRSEKKSLAAQMRPIVVLAHSLPRPRQCVVNTKNSAAGDNLNGRHPSPLSANDSHTPSLAADLTASWQHASFLSTHCQQWHRKRRSLA